MEAVVPPEITTELTQILANLLQGDNEIRSNAEKTVNERLSQTPEHYILALGQFGITANTDVMRSFALVILRRFLFRKTHPAQSQNEKAPSHSPVLYDRLSAATLATLERLLLHSLTHELAASTRRTSVDTITDVANNAMSRGRPWHALQAQAFSMAENQDPAMREAAFRVFSLSPNLILDLQLKSVLAVLGKGLHDAESAEVRLAALTASVSYMSSLHDPRQLSQAIYLLRNMIDILPGLPLSHLARALRTVDVLATTRTFIFAIYIPALLSFLPSLVLPPSDPGPTPTVARPFPAGSSAGASGSSSFIFPPVDSGAGIGGKEDGNEDEEREGVRRAAVELMLTVCEGSPSVVRKVEAWVATLVRACLEGMGQLPDGPGAVETWLESDPSDDATEEGYPHSYEHALDRLAVALGGQVVLPHAFRFIPSMLASYDWRLRHAGLMAISAIAEGTSKVMCDELAKVVELITPMFTDTHPRVRYAACQCLGQLCTDLDEAIQLHFHQQVFSVLIPALEAPEARIKAHAAAALINFCEGVERETILPYLDAIVERLLRLLNPDDTQQTKRYVQEQAITSLAMVADASEATFAKHYSSIMPMLLNVIRNATGAEYGKLRAKAMECAGLVAIAVGQDVFRPDANTFVELLIQIQNTPIDTSDGFTAHYLIAAWAKVCQAMGDEFEPYLPIVMPPLLDTASAKAELSIYDDEEPVQEREGWETLEVDGRRVGIRTSSIEEKCQAFETLVIYASTLRARFAPYLTQTLELVIPGLQFELHEGVREACSIILPVLVSCGKSSGTLTEQMASVVFSHLATALGTEDIAGYASSLTKALMHTALVLGGPSALPSAFQEGIIDAVKRQLQLIAERRKERLSIDTRAISLERDQFGLFEEMEEFALEDISKLLQIFDPNHPLLVAVSSVRELVINQEELGDDGSDRVLALASRYADIPVGTNMDPPP